MADVRQRHVADAKIVEHAQRGQAVVDLAAAFDAHQAGNLAGFLDAAHIGSRRGEFEILGVTRHDAANDIDLFERRLHRLRAGDIGWHPHRPELPANAPLMKARNVGLERAFELSAVRGQIDAPPFLAELAAQLFGPVIMPIDDRLALQHGIGSGEIGIIGRSGGAGDGEEGEQGKNAHG